MATASQLRERLTAKQSALAAIFTEAEITKEDGTKGWDFEKVTSLGNEVRGSIAVAEKVKQFDLELNDIASQVEAIEAAEAAAGRAREREKTVKPPIHPAPGGGTKAFKSIGEMVVEAKEFGGWHKSGRGGGVTLQFPDMLPSEFIAAGMKANTFGQKTLMTTSAGWDPEYFRQPGFVDAVTRPIQVSDIFPSGRTGTDTIAYMEETTRTHSAAEKAEGATFAESTFAFTERTSAVRKITDSLPVTDEQLEDVALIESYINDRLTFGVRQRLDLQLMLGNGTPPNLEGLANVTGIQTQAKGADTIPDTIHKLMTTIRITGRATPTNIVMHPTDWQTVRLSKTADGIYIWGAPSDSGVPRMWGLPVAEFDGGSAGTAYVGSFMPAYVSIFERRGVDIQVGYTGTQFVEGKRTVRADMRAALVFFRPAAFGTATGL